MRDYMLDPKKILKAVFAAAAGIFVIFYMYRQVIGLARETLETQNAVAVTYEKSVSSVGYIFRSEKVLEYSGGGEVFAVCGDGEKVAAGSAVANIYSDTAVAGSKARIDDIDKKLAILESSTVDQEYFSADIAKLEKDRNEIMDSVMRSKAENNYETCMVKRDKLLISMNKLATVKSGVSFESQINKLSEERHALSARQGEAYTSIYTPESGYYSGTVDGYENIFSPSVLDEMTVADFRNLTERLSDEKSVSSNAGKIITDSRWYVCCEISKGDIGAFETGNEYRVSFPYSSGGTAIEMELYRVVNETDKNEAVLIFTTDELPQSFGYMRSQKIEISSESYSGLRVPKAAMRKLNDDIDGVYILVGETVRFRRAEIIYEIDDYYIVRTESEDEKTQNAAEQSDVNKNESEGEGGADKAVLENSAKTEEDSEKISSPENSVTETETPKKYRYLSLYDNVILGGKDLYDGKRIK